MAIHSQHTRPLILAGDVTCSESTEAERFLKVAQKHYEDECRQKQERTDAARKQAALDRIGQVGQARSIAGRRSTRCHDDRRASGFEESVELKDQLDYRSLDIFP